VQIGLDIGAKNLVPIHWGTIALGWDDLFRSGPKFRKEALRKGIADKNIWLMKIGETRDF
jgi:L-ascorbate metabolism protein UlaG (beta-lactamase superfamily)